MRGRMDNPRSCGEGTFPKSCTAGPTKVYSRMRGGNKAFTNTRLAETGLSPHKRWEHPEAAPERRDHGAIPERAGERGHARSGATNFKSIPSETGNQFAKRAIASSVGLSPRTRGEPPRTAKFKGGARSIPAHAGELG
jgi:hypothetical protein